MSFDRSAPVLLFQGDYYGTLAVARALGRADVPVTLADPTPITRAAGSRFVKRRLRCPPIDEPDAFLDWLAAFGEREPGHVLIPASDASAWLFARHAPRLARSFRLYAPPFETLLGLLDKHRLHDAAEAAGLAVPMTVSPTSRAEALRLADSLVFPVVLKPRCQVFLASGWKGGFVPSRRAFPAALDAFLAANVFGKAALAAEPDLRWPMVQEYFPRAEAGIYGLSGFLGRDGEPMILRAARKVLQRPRRFGIGVCFEAVAVDAELPSALRRLFEASGYFGIFEAELVEARGRLHLIDMNPRPYSQMAFDEARGVPLSLLHYLGATGQTAALAALLHDSTRDDDGVTAYHHRLLLDGVRAAQWIAGRLRGQAPEPWDVWLAEHHGRTSDAVRATDDPLPVAIDAYKHVVQATRHPRSFLRSFMRGDGLGS